MTPADVQALADAFGIDIARLTEPSVSSVPHHCLGLWNCQDDGFYRFVYHQVRGAEGPEWLTNDRTPAQLLRWWDTYLRPSNPSNTQPA